MAVPATNPNFEFSSEVEYLDTTPVGNVGNGNSGENFYQNNLNTNTGNNMNFDTGTFSSGSGGNPTVAALETLSVPDLIQMTVVYAFLIAAALSAIFIFVGGISFILSGGNDEKIKKAVNTIRYAIVGLIVTILSFTLVTIVGRMFGFNFMEYISYSKIKNSLNQLTSSVSQEPSNAFEIQR
jgi:hypothetical protein